MDLSQFHVVSVVSNPVRYKSRYNLYKKFRTDIERKGAKLWTCELQTGARFHKITNHEHPRDFQIWTTGLDGIIWNKEGLQNYMVTQMTMHNPNWRNVCFVDGDVKFDDNFVEETAHALQLHPVVQPWSKSLDFGPDGDPIGDKMQLSYAYCHFNNIEVRGSSPYVRGGHPGYALAMRREAYNHLGGLIDIAALGSGDRHMICGLVGKIEDSYHPGVSAGYKHFLHQWQNRALKNIKKNLGYVPQLCRHMFHGSKKNRHYGDRWQVLVKWQFDPYTDLKREANGLWQLIVDDERQIGFRDALYKYFRSRQEDANCL